MPCETWRRNVEEESREIGWTMHVDELSKRTDGCWL